MPETETAPVVEKPKEAAIAKPEPTAAEKAAAADAAGRANYERAKAIQRGEDPKEPAKRDESGKFAAKEKPDGEDAGEPAGAAEAAAKDGAPVAGAPETAEDRERYVTALRAMRRDGMSREDAEEYVATPKGLAFAAGRVKAQAKIDEKLSGSGAERPRAADSRGPTPRDASTKGAVDDGPGGESTGTNPDDDLIPANVRETLTEDELKALRASVAKRIAAADKAAREREAKADTALEASLEDRCVFVTRELSASFPALKAAEPPAEFTSKLDALNRTGSYSLSTIEGVRELFMDAAHIVYGKALQEQARRQSIAANRTARAGAPFTGTGGEAPAKPLTPDERSRLAYEATKKANSPQDAARRYKESVGKR